MSQVLVLHALRAENKQHRSYRLDRIVGARATTRTFVPSYAVELAPNTLLKWMKQPEFDAAYREARRLAFRQSVARLQQASGAAVSTLTKIMVDVNAPHSTRVRAADSVLDHAAKAIEIGSRRSATARKGPETAIWEIAIADRTLLQIPSPSRVSSRRLKTMSQRVPPEPPKLTR